MHPESFTEESVDDYPRGTVNVLLLSLERRDGNALACATAVLRSAFDHLFRSYCYRTNENGQAMCTLLVLASRV
jgi:hypothetical protein